MSKEKDTPIQNGWGPGQPQKSENTEGSKPKEK